MKKLISLPLSFFIIVFLAIFALSFLPQVELIVNVKPHNQSTVLAQGVNNSGEEKPGCSIFAYYDKFDELNNEINALYDRGYHLKEFSVQQIRANTYLSGSYTNYDLKAFAAVCKD